MLIRNVWRLLETVDMNAFHSKENAVIAMYHLIYLLRITSYLCTIGAKDSVVNVSDNCFCSTGTEII